MKLAVLVPIVLAAATAGAVGSPVAQSAGMPCQPKMTKVDGKSAVQHCGPATVTLKISGRSYTFKNGFCMTSGSTSFMLQMGTLVVLDHAHNAGLPHLNLIGAGHTADLTAISGGRSLVGGMTLVTLRGSGKSTGTFVNRLPTPKISGSWNCHGVIFKG